MFSMQFASHSMKVFLYTVAVLVKTKISHTTHLGTSTPSPCFLYVINDVMNLQSFATKWDPLLQSEIHSINNYSV